MTNKTSHLKNKAAINRIQSSLSGDKKLLSIFFTAGFPELESTVPVIQALQDAGADMIEIGLPFSDPLADGPTIQESSTRALKNGMNTELLFRQLKDIRKTVHIPLLIMGYFNPVLQYGVEEFCRKCAEVGIDGLILPDLPLDVYTREYREIFEANGLLNIFLVTPQTSEERLRQIDAASNGFIYAVSSSSTTGGKQSFGEEQLAYLKKLDEMQIKNPHLVGFGIRDSVTFDRSTQYSNGAILGSEFIRQLDEHGIKGISKFIRAFRPNGGG